MVIISMVVLCNANALMNIDRRRSGLSNTPLQIKYDNNCCHRDISPLRSQISR